jgi:cyanophycinase-like exopeptidase
LKEIASHARSRVLVVATLASEEPAQQWESYREAFGDLDVGDIRHLQIEGREGASTQSNLEMVDNASVVY